MQDIREGERVHVPRGGQAADQSLHQAAAGDGGVRVDPLRGCGGHQGGPDPLLDRRHRARAGARSWGQHHNSRGSCPHLPRAGGHIQEAEPSSASVLTQQIDTQCLIQA